MQGTELAYTNLLRGGKVIVICCDECKTNQGVKQYFGFCPSCWLKKTKDERAALADTDNVFNVIYRVPPVPGRSSRVLVGIWRIAVTAAVAWLAYRRLR